jgi:hypothetical protein
VLAGCGSSGSGTVPVNGTLTIDGQPASNLIITLVPVDSTKPVATGNVSSGSFTLFSGTAGDPGAVPGKYKVVLQAAVAASSQEEAKARYAGQSKAGGKGGGTAAPQETVSMPFAERYASSATSDKEVEITSGKNDLTIDVSSN